MSELVDTPYISGHEPDAALWHCIFRFLGSVVLAADDAGQQQGNTDGVGHYTHYLFWHGLSSMWKRSNLCKVC